MFSNQTPNYGLPQYAQNDTLNVLTDLNGAMETIDSTMKTNELAAASAQSKADGADTKANNNATAITDLQTAHGADRTDINTLTGAVNTINSLIGNGEPTTTDKTLIGAINELVTKLTAKEAFIGVYHKDVTADGIKTYSQLITDLVNLINADIAAMPVDEKLMNTTFEVFGIGFFQNSDANYFTTGGQSLPALGEYSSSFAGANEFGVRTIYLSDKTFRIGKTDTTAGTSTVTDYTSLVPTEGITVSFNAQIFKNIL